MARDDSDGAGRSPARDVALVASFVVGLAAAVAYVVAAVVPWYTSRRVDGPFESGSAASVAFAPLVVALAPFVVLPLRWARSTTPVLWAALVGGMGALLGLVVDDMQAAASDTRVVAERGPAVLVGSVALVVVALALAAWARPRPRGADVPTATAGLAAGGVVVSVFVPLAGVRESTADTYLGTVRGWDAGYLAWAVLLVGLGLVEASIVRGPTAPVGLRAVAAGMVLIGGALVAVGVAGDGVEVAVRPGGVLLAGCVVALAVAVVVGRRRPRWGPEPPVRRPGEASSG